MILFKIVVELFLLIVAVLLKLLSFFGLIIRFIVDIVLKPKETLKKRTKKELLDKANKDLDEVVFSKDKLHNLAKVEDRKSYSQKNTVNTNNKDYLLDKDDFDFKSNKEVFKNVFLYLIKFKWIFNFRFLVTATFSFGFLIIYAMWNLPDYRSLENYNPSLVTRFYSEDGFIVSELAKENRTYTELTNIPYKVKEAFIFAEDKNFYSHHGFDYKGLARAALNNVFKVFVNNNRNLMGASTITQQVVKNLLLNKDRTIQRKLKEAILTIKLERHFSKNYILELYLNEIYLGKGAYGVSSAALNYFNKSLSDLTLAETAFLAILPRSPNIFNNLDENYDLIKYRRDSVIEQMLQNNVISKEEAEKAIATPIAVVGRSNLATTYSAYVGEEVRKSLINIVGEDDVYSKGLIVKTTINNTLQKYSYIALRRGIEEYDRRHGYRGAITNLIDSDEDISKEDLLEKEHNGSPYWLYLLKNSSFYRTYNGYLGETDIAIVLDVSKDKAVVGLKYGKTTDLTRDKNAWAIKYNGKLFNKNMHLSDMTNILKAGDIILVREERDKNTSKDYWALDQIPKANGAILVMNPVNGNILAMQGGYSFNLSKFNRAMQALRQPGSSFKPFVYLTALQHGFSPNSLILDAPFISKNEDSIWKPKNHKSRYAGYVTLRNALEYSRNLATLRLADKLNIDDISQNARRFGIYDTDLDDMSNVLGSKETTLVRMVRAYSSLANGGKKIDYSLISSIQDKNGNFLYKNDDRDCKDCSNVAWSNQEVPVLEDNREQIADVKDIYIIDNLLKGVVDRGTGVNARIPGYDIAGKTGTTNESKDVWFFGFTPQVVVGVYIGFDTPEDLGSAEDGTSISVPIFWYFMSKAIYMFDKLPFAVPEGITMDLIDYKTGKKVDKNSEKAFSEAFRPQDLENMEKESENSGGSKELEEQGIY